MKKSVVILLHLAYWITYAFLFAFAVFALTIDAKDAQGVPIAYNILTPLNIAFFLLLFFLNSALSFYTAYFFLFPQFLQQKKILLLIVFGILSILAAEFISIALVYLVSGIYVIHSMPPGLVLVMGLIPGIHAMLGLVVRGFVTSYADIRVKEDLKHKNLEMELELIKARIHPHFLFNTINNIDVLIRKDADKASDYLNKLSDILRYMLYETKTEKVAFAKEVEHLEKYLDLQKIRTSNPDYIHYHVNGEANPLVAPMLFMPFIENAVKHAENKKAEKAINISFDVNRERIIFECSNAYSEGNATKALNGGLGKDLALKRLELLYPGQYHLDINDNAGIYHVKLVLLLKA